MRIIVTNTPTAPLETPHFVKHRICLKAIVFLLVLTLQSVLLSLVWLSPIWAQPPTPVPKLFPVPVPLPGTIQDSGRIAFASWRDGNGEIYVINANGSGLTRLTINTAGDAQPSFSPDGRNIAFVSNRDGNDEIYIMNADGTGQTRLTHNTRADQHPTFSPNGKSIMFTSWREEDAPANMFVMNVDGSQQRRLAVGMDAPRSGMEAVFHPNGKQVAFSNGSIYIMNSDGSGITKLTQHGYEPKFSPDGTKIAFTSRDAHEGWHVFIMYADGSDQRRLTRSPASAGEPCFSPDGQKIVFVSKYEGKDQLCVMDVEGSSLRGLIEADSQNLHPSWGAECAATGHELMPDQL